MLIFNLVAALILRRVKQERVAMTGEPRKRTPAARGMARIEERFFKALMLLSFVLVGGSLLLIVGTVLVRGLPGLTWDMLTQTPKGGFYMGKEGGILNAILGSLAAGDRRDDPRLRPRAAASPCTSTSYAAQRAALPT